MIFPQENSLDNWLDANANPEIDKFLERNLAITEKVNAVLKQRGIKKGEFAKMLGKKPSEITKWLTGLHNLTLKSITKMEVALNIDLLNLEPAYIYLGSVPGGSKDLPNAIVKYEDTYYSNAV